MTDMLSRHTRFSVFKLPKNGSISSVSGLAQVVRSPHFQSCALDQLSHLSMHGSTPMIIACGARIVKQNASTNRGLCPKQKLCHRSFDTSAAKLAFLCGKVAA